MADPITPNKGLTIPDTGTHPNTWGPVLNGNFDLVDAFFGTTTSIVLSSGAVTITSVQSQALRINFTGSLTGNVTVTIPQLAGYFYFHDQTTRNGYSIQITTGSSSGRTQNLPAKMSNLFTDGTNCWLVVEPNHGEMKPFGGFVPPPLWQSAYGQALSRTTYPELFANLTFAATATITSGSNTLTNVSAFPVGLTGPAPYSIPIEGPGIPTGTVVTAWSASGGNTYTISNNATASSTGSTITLLPHGQGDGSTTFNVQDMRGRGAFGMDSQGGTSANRLTSASMGNGLTLASGGGNESLQAHSHNVTDLGHTHTVSDPGHNHTQSPHGHSVTDPGHVHGVNDPGHFHAYALPVPNTNGPNSGVNSTGLFSLTNAPLYPSNNATTGISIHSASTGIGIQPQVANINAATTGITNQPNTTGISVAAQGTGTSQNVPPALVQNYIVYVGQ